MTLPDIEGAIAQKHWLSGTTATNCADRSEGEDVDDAGLDSIRVLTICLLVLKNGFTIIGKSAPASPQNFNAELGRDLAYDDAIRQLWPLMGFALRDRLASGAVA